MILNTRVNMQGFYNRCYLNNIHRVKSAYEPSGSPAQAGAYPGFRSMKRLGLFLPPPGWDASLLQGNNIHNTTKIHGIKNKRTTSKCGKCAEK